MASAERAWSRGPAAQNPDVPGNDSIDLQSLALLPDLLLLCGDEPSMLAKRAEVRFDFVGMSERTDFFQSACGELRFGSVWQRFLGRLQDLQADKKLRSSSGYRDMMDKVSALAPARNVLVVGVEVPARSNDLRRVMESISLSRHRVTHKSLPLLPGNGKFQNINSGLRDIELSAFDWLIVLDDDVIFQKDFLDVFIYAAESADVRLCQPAHTLQSFQSYELTRRCSNSLARVTRFVECGPLTAFHKSIYKHILPFPDLRWAWGTDIYWGEIARREEFRMGVIDCTPMTHTRPVARSYDDIEAKREAVRFLEALGVTRSKSSILENVEVISHF